MSFKEQELEKYPRLIKPSIEYMDSYIAARREFAGAGLTIYDEFKGVTPDAHAIEKLLQRFEDQSRGVGLPEGWVPNTTFWLVDNGEYIGSGNIRHTLTDRLERFGGHIGYEIRPSRWGKGYGTMLLRLLLPEAAKLGIKSALVTCAANNTASKRIIEKNGGVLIDCIDIEIGSQIRPTLRYRIETKI